MKAESPGSAKPSSVSALLEHAGMIGSRSSNLITSSGQNRPHSKAEHMTAVVPFDSLPNALAKWEPSTHDTPEPRSGSHHLSYREGLVSIAARRLDRRFGP